MGIKELRQDYHNRICKEVLRTRFDKERNDTYPNIADKQNPNSRKIAWGLFRKLGCHEDQSKLSESAGTLFQKITKDFLKNAFNLLHHLRPGAWHYETESKISSFDQYSHLAALEEMIKENMPLKSALGGNYIITPDIVISRSPVSEIEINSIDRIISTEDNISKLTPLRESNHNIVNSILHASISCKWTIRSDRAQNTRTEALNLIRNRKGPLPHVVAVTAEPLPTRLSSLALGTGDLDCVSFLSG
ncbi:MAG: restriction endonuclease [Deltaproteobacteria bacterium]|nr:restriction endonuclease [Deltaproteobacteria bacterium]